MPFNPSMLAVLLHPHEIEELTQFIPVGEKPLWHYWPEFVQKYLRTGKSEVTVKGVRDGLRFAIRRLKIYTIEQLNRPSSVEDALFEYKEANHIKNNTFNSYRKNFNTFCIWLEKRGYIEKNNIGKIDKCKAEYDEHLTLTDEQVALIIQYIHDRKQTRLERFRNIFFIDLLRHTGARPCELLAIKMKDIEPYKGSYRLVLQGRKQKGRKRFFKFEQYLYESYEAYMNFRMETRPGEEFLFVSSSRKTGWTYAGVKKLFQTMSKDLGFKVTAYAFRRYVATRLYNLNMPLQKISDYLGHHRSTTTLRYIERSCILTKDCSEAMATVAQINSTNASQLTYSFADSNRKDKSLSS